MAQAITESTRFALQRRAREVLGEQEGDTLMAHLPPVGWADVATKQDLEALRVATKQDLKGLSKDLEALRVATKQDIEALSKDMEVLGHRLDARMDRSFRRQTMWIVSVLFAQSGLVAWLLERSTS